MASMTTTHLLDTGTFCYQHPGVETALRCNRCNNYICPQCAKKSMVGYKCPTCIRTIQNHFFNGKRHDYAIAALIALPLSLLAALVFIFLIGSIGWFSWLIAIWAAPVAAGFITEAVRWGVGQRRSRYLGRVVAGCFMAIILLAMLALVIISLFGGNILDELYILIVPGILLFMGTGVILARLR